MGISFVCEGDIHHHDPFDGRIRPIGHRIIADDLNLAFAAADVFVGEIAGGVRAFAEPADEIQNLPPFEAGSWNSIQEGDVHVNLIARHRPAIVGRVSARILRVSASAPGRGQTIALLHGSDILDRRHGAGGRETRRLRPARRVKERRGWFLFVRRSCKNGSEKEAGNKHG